MTAHKLHHAWVERRIGAVAEDSSHQQRQALCVIGAGPAQHQTIAEITAVIPCSLFDRHGMTSFRRRRDYSYFVSISALIDPLLPSVTMTIKTKTRS
jgi:hypothetical protein